jgi:hypothetical protein
MARRTPKKPKKAPVAAPARASVAATGVAPERRVTLWLGPSGAFRFTSRARPVSGPQWSRAGELRLVGKEYEQHIHPNDVGLLPRGACVGDCTRQRYCLGGPRLLYIDVTRTCRVCRQTFVFSAREQKHWYETLQFWTDSEAVDCLACRRSNRARRAVQQRHEVAVAGVAATPDDAAARLALARSTLELFEATGSGDLQGGIAAARAARRIARLAMPEALYWEGRLQLLAGRDAAASFSRFIDEAALSRRRGLAALVQDARARLGPAADG